jgi:hypothetical protein
MKLEFIPFSKVLLVCVDCVDSIRAIESMKKSMSVFPFRKCLLFTDYKSYCGPNRIYETYIGCNDQTISIVNIPKISSMKEYSRFMMKDLGRFFLENDYRRFDATHVLIVQHDSWIVNVNSWTDEFLEYDYIGAPFACHPELKQGNGGFSLRSIDLLETLATDPKIEKVDGEDINICVDYRDYLESKGFKFAPEELAAKFSVEGRPITNQFGHHTSDNIKKGIDKLNRIVYINKNKIFPEKGFAYTLPENGDFIDYANYGIKLDKGERMKYPEIGVQENEFLEKYDTIDKAYEHFCKTKTDINEHLPLLKSIVEQKDVETVIELGLRTAHSCVGMLAGRPKTMTSYDISDHWRGIYYHKMVEKIIPPETEWKFIQANDLYIEIPECDFLFIDTLHTKNQLSKELALHSSKAKKYIGFHDTVSFGHRGEDGSAGGLMDAIGEFLKRELDIWEIIEDRKNNNGLMILKRK